MDVLTSAYSVGFHVQCCGRTTSVRVSNEEAFRLKRTGDKLYAVNKTGRFAQIRKQARF